LELGVSLSDRIGSCLSARLKAEEGAVMKILRFAFVVIFVLFSCKEAKIDTIASTRRGVGATSQQPGPVCSIFFLKEKYVTTEGDAFVVAVEADCPPNSPNDAKIEFVQPPPRFVTMSYMYRSEISALKLILVQPQRGDAGNYLITFSSSHCSGGAGCGVTGFKLKVKAAQ